MDDILSVSNLVKKYDDHVVIKDVSFSLKRGKIYGLLGPNGAGKTTIMKLITNEIAKDGGVISYSDDLKIKYLMDVPMFYEFMKVEEYLLFIGELNKIENNKERITNLLNETNLYEHKDKIIKQLSRGLRQKLGIASVLVNDIDLLILDEPVSALDPVGRKEVLDLIYSLKGKMCVVLSSHILVDIEKRCEDIILINDGKIIVNDECSKILENKNILLVKFKTREDAIKIKELYENSCFSSRYENTLELDYDDLTTLELDVLKKAKKLAIEIEKLEVKKDTLEDIFLQGVIGHE